MRFYKLEKIANEFLGDKDFINGVAIIAGVEILNVMGQLKTRDGKRFKNKDEAIEYIWEKIKDTDWNG